ncbi:MAG: peptidylprolyl isomerase [Chloroflexi bacterium]|nr:MAG: peptidylprolyl isomerase [Chloroflexota bacterium]
MSTPTRANLPFTIGVLVVVVGGLIGAGIGINAVAGGNSASGVPPTPFVSTPTPSVSATPSPTPTPSQVAYANCGPANFGPVLAPLNPPADVHKYSAPPPFQIKTSKLYLATITTAKGVITLCLEPRLAPNTVNNFVALARNHFYDGLTFHRVVAKFVIQGGDPTGTGSGSAGYRLRDEPVRQKYIIGAVAMANSGANTNGSQFFICIADDSSQLQPKYNLFGRAAGGLDVAQRIAKGDVMQTVTVSEQQ